MYGLIVAIFELRTGGVERHVPSKRFRFSSRLYLRWRLMITRQASGMLQSRRGDAKSSREGHQTSRHHDPDGVPERHWVSFLSMSRPDPFIKVVIPRFLQSRHDSWRLDEFRSPSFGGRSLCKRPARYFRFPGRLIEDAFPRKYESTSTVCRLNRESIRNDSPFSLAASTISRIFMLPVGSQPSSDM